MGVIEVWISSVTRFIRCFTQVCSSQLHLILSIWHMAILQPKIFPVTQSCIALVFGKDPINTRK